MNDKTVHRVIHTLNKGQRNGRPIMRFSLEFGATHNTIPRLNIRFKTIYDPRPGTGLEQG
jgi:hypothetical protein